MNSFQSPTPWTWDYGPFDLFLRLKDANDEYVDCIKMSRREINNRLSDNPYLVLEAVNSYYKNKETIEKFEKAGNYILQLLQDKTGLDKELWFNAEILLRTAMSLKEYS